MSDEYGYVLLPGHLIGKKVMVVELDQSLEGMVVRPFGKRISSSAIHPRSATPGIPGITGDY